MNIRYAVRVHKIGGRPEWKKATPSSNEASTSDRKSSALTQYDGMTSESRKQDRMDIVLTPCKRSERKLDRMQFCQPLDIFNSDFHPRKRPARIVRTGL